MSTTTAPTADPMTRALEPLAIVVVVMLCLSWGFNQVAAKFAITEIPPLIQATVRSTVAAVLVLAWMRARGLPVFARDGTLIPGIVAGLLFGTEFMLAYRALIWTTASRSGLFLYCAPFMVVLGARFFLPGDRFAPSQWFGLALSFAGVAIALGLPMPGEHPMQLVGDFMVVVAAVFWAATTLVVKASALNRVSAEKTLLYQLVVSAPMMAVGALVFGEKITGMPSAVAVGALAYQTLWVVSFTFVIWFSLIARYSASRLSAFTFLTPLCGIAAGNLVLGEPVTPAFALAAALVAVGLILVNRSR